MKLVKKILASAMTVAVAAGSFAALPAGAASGGVENNAVLRVWVPKSELKLTKTLCNSFVNKYKSKNISVKVSAKDVYEASIYLFSDANEAADVMSVASDQITYLVNSGAISPIAKTYASKAKKANSKASVKAFTVNKTLYAHPKSIMGYCLVYDKKVVSAKKAKSLESVLEACKKKGKSFIMDVENGYYSSMFLFTGGLKLNGLKSDGVTQKFTKYNKKTVVNTLKAFSKLFHKYSSVFKKMDVYSIASQFASGKCGAGIDGIWNYSANKAHLGKRFGAAKLPTIKVGSSKKQICSLLGYDCNVVNTGSDYPQAAQALAAYLSDKNAQKKLVASLKIAPTNKSLAKSKAVKKNPMLKALTDQQKCSVAQISITNTFWEPVGALGSKIVSKKTNPNTYNFTKLLNNTIKRIKYY